MRIISFNVNGIRATVKKGLFESIEKMNPDVLCFQETKANDEQVRAALFGLDGYYLYSYSAERPGYSGTAILSRKEPISVKNGLGIDEHDDQGRAITIEFDDFYLVNTYVPNSGHGLVRLDYRGRWDAALLEYLRLLEKKKPVIWCGDLNVAHQPIDLANPKSNYNKTSGYTQQEIDGMDAVHAAGFIDTYRSMYPEEVKYSWWSARFNSRERNIGWRIDYFMISASLKPRLKEAFILNEIEGSDHCPVGIVIE